jgi:flagellar P-ring protein precursor FlgI
MKLVQSVLLAALGLAAMMTGPTPAGAQAKAAQKHEKVAMAQGGATASGMASDNAATGLVRIKDIADVQGARSNQLIGYGLVVGLEGTGDGQSAQFTPSSIANLLRRFGVNVPLNQITVKNVAAVMVTAELPPFVKSGSKIDATVSSMGDAKSLQGGTLLQTVLYGADGDPYATAQGQLSIGGFNFGQGGSSVQKNHVNVGRIPHGALVEQEVPMTLVEGNTLQITLREPDFTTARRTAAAIRRQMPGIMAQAIDGATISVTVPADRAADAIDFISEIETVRVTPDTPARIVINERTGTVAMTGRVRIAEGAVAQGAIHVQVTNTPVVVPAPNFSKNAPPPVVLAQKDTQATETGGGLANVPATTTLDQLVHALNALGVTPRDLISILQAMHTAGMINASIEVQ